MQTVKFLLHCGHSLGSHLLCFQSRPGSKLIVASDILAPDKIHALSSALTGHNAAFLSVLVDHLFVGERFELQGLDSQPGQPPPDKMMS